MSLYYKYRRLKIMKFLISKTLNLKYEFGMGYISIFIRNTS